MLTPNIAVIHKPLHNIRLHIDNDVFGIWKINLFVTPRFVMQFYWHVCKSNDVCEGFL